MNTFRNSPRLTYIGAWALGGLYNFMRDVFTTPLKPLFVLNMAYFSIWAILGLLTIYLLRRYPLRLHWRPCLLHLGVGIVLAQVDVTLGTWAGLHVLGTADGLSFVDIAIGAFKGCFHLGLIHYFLFVGILQGLHLHKLALTRSQEVTAQKAALVQAQLQSLKTQLQPHFLFNTLHSIASLMHYDVATADRMLNRLSELLRVSLREGGNPAVSLKTEISFIEAYVEIEKIRFEHRLGVKWSIPDDLHDNSIPPFILQPLVENAIKYGVAPRAAGGNIVIRAYAKDQALLLEVEDDAPEGLPKQEGFGIGLSNTCSRLEALYGGGQRFELIRAGMGTIARIRLPLLIPGVAT